MLDKIKSKLIGAAVSGVAMALVVPFAFSNYLSVLGADSSKKLAVDVAQRPAHKYGGPGMDFDNEIKLVFKIAGRVFFKETKKPASGVVLSIANVEQTAVTDADGKFKFGPFYYNTDITVLEVREAKTEKLLGTKEVKLVGDDIATTEISL